MGAGWAPWALGTPAALRKIRQFAGRLQKLKNPPGRVVILRLSALAAHRRLEKPSNKKQTCASLCHSAGGKLPVGSRLDAFERCLSSPPQRYSDTGRQRQARPGPHSRSICTTCLDQELPDGFVLARAGLIAISRTILGGSAGTAEVVRSPTRFVPAKIACPDKNSRKVVGSLPPCRKNRCKAPIR